MKRHIRATMVALSLVTFMLSAPVSAKEFSIESPIDDSDTEVLVIENGTISVLGTKLDGDADLTALGSTPAEVCTYVHGELEKLAVLYGTLVGDDVLDTDLALTEEEDAPYDSDREGDLLVVEECREMRDYAQSILWDNAPAPVVPYTCGTLRGVESCISVKHYQCDIGFLTYYNYVSICMGGVFPDN